MISKIQIKNSNYNALHQRTVSSLFLFYFVCSQTRIFNRIACAYAPHQINAHSVTYENIVEMNKYSHIVRAATAENNSAHIACVVEK